MSSSSWWKLSDFRSADGGGIAIQYGIMFLAILVLAGAAVDFGRQETAERELTAAVDAAAIAGARMAMTSDDADQIKAHALVYLKDNFKMSEMSSHEITVVDNKIFVSAKADIKTTILGLGGVPKFHIKSEAVAQYGRAGTLEIALVLDTSLSMDGAPLAALKDASTGLANSIIVDGNNDTRISIVPFGNFVNIGTQHRNASWLDLSGEYSQNVSKCEITWSSYREAGCTETTEPCVRDGVNTTCPAWDCSGTSTPAETCRTETQEHKWWGCVNSRGRPRNIEDSGYVSEKVPGYIRTDMWACGAPILPLTSDLSDIEDAIDDLSPAGETYMTTGLTWGYRALSPNRPFDEGVAFPTSAGSMDEKVLILMSDGANTRSLGSNSEHWEVNITDANTTTLDACTEIKDAGIEIYTVAFNLPDTNTRDLLQDCASEDKNFLIADGAVELAESFRKIGADLLDIALVN